MARPANGWKLGQRDGIYHVRFTHDQRRYQISTSERDRARAAIAAPAIYAKVVGAHKRKPVVTQARPLASVIADWLADWETDHDERTVQTHRQYSRHWVSYFLTLPRMNAKHLANYARERLRAVLRISVRKELTALRGFLRWCVEQEVLEELPRFPELPKRAIGVAARPRRLPPDLTVNQVERLLSFLPERGRGGTHPRARFTVAWETGLRPETLSLISAPEWYRKGASELEVPRAGDKARAARTLPLTAAARAALDSVCPEEGGLLFGPNKLRPYLREAARAAGLPAETVAAITPYALRHARASAILEAGGGQQGLMYLLGHSNPTTTDRYLEARKRHAEAALRLLEARSDVVFSTYEDERDG